MALEPPANIGVRNINVYALDFKALQLQFSLVPEKN